VCLHTYSECVCTCRLMCVQVCECVRLSVYVYVRARVRRMWVCVVCARMCVCVRAPRAQVRICAVSSAFRRRQIEFVLWRAKVPRALLRCACGSEHSRVCICRGVTSSVYLYASIMPVSMDAFNMCVRKCVLICEGM
jgi:hypothetical protein